MIPDHFEQVWQGRIDTEDGDEGLRIHQIIQPYSAEARGPGITLAGLASDLGVERNAGRLGAAAGPKALRRALANLAWHFQDHPLYDAGDTQIEPKSRADALASAQADYAQVVAAALASDQFVIGLGGGHEIAWGSYQACRQHLDQLGKHEAVLGVVNFDAHFDLRGPADNVAWVGSSGTPFYQVAKDCQQRNLAFRYACLGINQSANTPALFHFAEQHHVRYLLDEQCETVASRRLVEEFIAGVDYLYVTICLDALPASVAPGVSAPAALGVPMAFIIATLNIIKHTCAHHKVTWLMSDIAELNPRFDLDQRTARAAARLAYETIRLAR